MLARTTGTAFHPTRRDAKPPLQCISILPQYGDCLHTSALIVLSLKIVDVLPELLRQRVNLVRGGIDRCGSFRFHRAPPAMMMPLAGDSGQHPFPRTPDGIKNHFRSV